ncbi:hypothetical protein [Candidatus Paracaedibacter symbiosus]|uniref:hypothetical protein n=1 Tax=Candidatus Paracaedibacter symbiosus TaxID=244582 RepID=UPI000509AA55|nr:hypothetical protein [Candidatus Paracaedibacter symbiosus]
MNGNDIFDLLRILISISDSTIRDCVVTYAKNLLAENVGKEKVDAVIGRLAKIYHHLINGDVINAAKGLFTPGMDADDKVRILGALCCIDNLKVREAAIKWCSKHLDKYSKYDHANVINTIAKILANVESNRVYHNIYSFLDNTGEAGKRQDWLEEIIVSTFKKNPSNFIEIIESLT